MTTYAADFLPNVAALTTDRPVLAGVGFADLAAEVGAA